MKLGQLVQKLKGGATLQIAWPSQKHVFFVFRKGSNLKMKNESNLKIGNNL
jgi:hypothetical protein